MSTPAYLVHISSANPSYQKGHIITQVVHEQGLKPEADSSSCNLQGCLVLSSIRSSSWIFFLLQNENWMDSYSSLFANSLLNTDSTQSIHLAGKLRASSYHSQHTSQVRLQHSNLIHSKSLLSSFSRTAVFPTLLHQVRF